MRRVRLFSYGTLITGALSPAIERLLSRYCRDRREGWIRGRLLDLGAYPAALPAANRDQRVYGQVLELDEPRHCLPLIDRYEGYDPAAPGRSLYVRESVSVYVEGQPTPETAWVYWLNQRPPRSRPIPGGDYRAYLAGHEPAGDINR